MRAEAIDAFVFIQNKPPKPPPIHVKHHTYVHNTRKMKWTELNAKLHYFMYVKLCVLFLSLISDPTLPAKILKSLK